MMMMMMNNDDDDDDDDESFSECFRLFSWWCLLVNNWATRPQKRVG